MSVLHLKAVLCWLTDDIVMSLYPCLASTSALQSWRCWGQLFVEASPSPSHSAAPAPAERRTEPGPPGCLHPEEPPSSWTSSSVGGSGWRGLFFYCHQSLFWRLKRGLIRLCLYYCRLKASYYWKNLSEMCVSSSKATFWMSRKCFLEEVL